MLTFPDLITKVASLELKSRQIVEGFLTGLHKSPFYGFSVEFAEHRPYNPGDEIRHIDWKVYAKSERHYVKQFEEETNLRCYILMDVSSSMDFKYFSEWTKLDYGVHLASAFALLMNRQRDAVSLVTFDQEIDTFLPPKSSYSHVRLVFSHLEKLLNRKKPEQMRRTASAKVIHEVAERIARRSLVVIISDLFENTGNQEELISALRHLRHKHHEVILFNLLEKKSERDLDFPDKKMTFKDLESGASMDVLPVQVREQYKQKIAEYTRKFTIVCSEAGIDYEEVDTASAFDHTLLKYLVKRQKTKSG